MTVSAECSDGATAFPIDTETAVRFMRAAMAEARKCVESEDVPVGAVAVLGEGIIASGRNRREGWHDPTAHAEILALREASLHLGSWRLNEVILFCTLEPCVMCAGAMIQSRLGGLVFGASDPKAGAAGSVVDVFAEPRWNHRVPHTGGVLAAECGDLLTQFFACARQRNAGEDSHRAVAGEPRSTRGEMAELVESARLEIE